MRKYLIFPVYEGLDRDHRKDRDQYGNRFGNAFAIDGTSKEDAVERAAFKTFSGPLSRKGKYAVIDFRQIDFFDIEVPSINIERRDK